MSKTASPYAFNATTAALKGQQATTGASSSVISKEIGPHVVSHKRFPKGSKIPKWIKKQSMGLMLTTFIASLVWTALGVLDMIELVGLRYLGTQTITVWLPTAYTAYFVLVGFYVFYQSIVGLRLPTNKKIQLFDAVHYNPILLFWGISILGAMLSMAYKLSAWFRISVADITEYDNFSTPVSLQWLYTNIRVQNTMIVDLAIMAVSWLAVGLVYATWRSPVVSEAVEKIKPSDEAAPVAAESDGESEGESGSGGDN